MNVRTAIYQVRPEVHLAQHPARVAQWQRAAAERRVKGI